MGQIKNIKLHIVTDIKTYHKLVVTNSNSQDDEGNNEFWQTPQQITHPVCTLWSFVIPHTKEDLCFMWIPKCTKKKFQLGFKGEEEKDYWYWTYATFEENLPKKYERIQRRNICKVTEEIRFPINEEIIV